MIGDTKKILRLFSRYESFVACWIVFVLLNWSFRNSNFIFNFLLRTVASETTNRVSRPDLLVVLVRLLEGAHVSAHYIFGSLDISCDAAFFLERLPNDPWPESRVTRHRISSQVNRISVRQWLGQLFSAAMSRSKVLPHMLVLRTRLVLERIHLKVHVCERLATLLF